MEHRFLHTMYNQLSLYHLTCCCQYVTAGSINLLCARREYKRPQVKPIAKKSVNSCTHSFLSEATTFIDTRGIASYKELLGVLFALFDLLETQVLDYSTFSAIH